MSSVEPKPRSRKLYVLWAIALTLLLALGLFSWLVVVPVMGVRSALEEASQRRKRQGYTVMPTDLKRKAPTEVAPGTRETTDNPKPSSKPNEKPYKRKNFYDEHGRNTGRTDETDHGRPEDHPNPHHHRRNPATGEWERDPDTGKKIWPGRHPDDPENEPPDDDGPTVPVPSS